MSICRIALHGYGGVGKDTVGLILAELLNLERRALGDIIKRQLDPFIQQHLGFSAFTTVPEEKKRIREVLVHWGYANYDALLAEFMQDLPDRCINTRIFKVEEARAWRDNSGIIVEVKRPGYTEVEPREAIELRACQQLGFIDLEINNNGTIDDLRRAMKLWVRCHILPTKRYTKKDPNDQLVQ